MSCKLSILSAAVILTVVYIVFCVAVHFSLPSCIAEEDGSVSDCGSQGHDNSILSWATSLFVGMLIAAMAMHLCCRRKSRPILSGLALSFLSLGFLSQGIIGLLFPNSGVDDGHGQVGYYMLTFVSYTFWTVSAVFLLCLLQVARDSMQQLFVPCQRSEWVVFGLVVSMFVLIAIACIWNSLALWNASYSGTDEHAQDTAANYVPIRILGSSRMLWHVFFCCFVIVFFYIWKTISYQKRIEAFPYNEMFWSVWICQMGVGAIVVMSALHDLVQFHRLGRVTERPEATACLNCFFLVTAFLIYKCMLMLYPMLVVEEKINETDSETDDEHIQVRKHDDDLDLDLVVDEEGGSFESCEVDFDKRDDEEEKREKAVSDEAIQNDEPSELWFSVASRFQDVSAALGLSTRSVNPGST